MADKEKSNEELNNESIARCDEIMSLLTKASQLAREDGGMDARVEEYIRNASEAVWQDRMYYAEHGLEDLNKLDDDERKREEEISERNSSDNIDINGELKEPTGMYNTPAAMAEIFKNNREVSDERCKEMRRKSIEKMKRGWGETDVMKKKKKEEEQKK